MVFSIDQLDFDKSQGLIPALIQDAATGRALMLGYMNREALERTMAEGRVSFFSRSKNRLWTKGESSGNFLYVVEMKADCDNDAILIKARPEGPVCHTGSDTCWNEENKTGDFLRQLEQIVLDRKARMPEGSYTTRLFEKGINKIAQKVGEEAVELVIEAKDDNRELFLNEAADLLFHYLVLLAAKDVRLEEVVGILEKRHRP